MVKVPYIGQGVEQQEQTRTDIISVVKDDQASKEEQMAELTKWKDYEVFEEGPRLKEKFAISSESSSTFRYLDLQIVQEDRKATVDQSHYMKLTLMQDPVQRS